MGDDNAKKGDTRQHGHPRFYQILYELRQLHSDKNYDYATGGDPLGNFKRRARIYSEYPGLDISDPVVVSLLDLFKQLDAALWLKSNGHEARVEGFVGRMRDVAVYAPISIILEEEGVAAGVQAIKTLRESIALDKQMAGTTTDASRPGASEYAR